MSSNALFFTVVLDRSYRLRYSGAAKQRMANLRKEGYSLVDLTDENPDVVQGALFAWAWACITEENPFRSPVEFRDMAEACKPDLIEALLSATVDCIKAGLPKGDESKNTQAENTPSPALSSA